MTITVPTKPLRDALAKLQPITSAKANLPELGAVTIGVGNLNLLLSATNLDQWMKLIVEGDTDQETDPFSVSSRDLYDTVRLCDAEQCALKVQDNYCQVIAGNSGAKLPLITTPMPVLPDAEWGKPVLIENLPTLLAKCLPFASTDPNRWILNGVHFSEKNGLVAANGYSLIKIQTAVVGEANVPSSAAALIAKEEEDVTVRFAKSMAEFSGGGWTLTTKLIEMADGSKYPSIKEGFANVQHRMVCNRVDAIKAAAFAALPLPTLVDVVSAEHGGDTLRFFTGQSAPNPRERTIEAKCDQNHTWAVSARKLATTLGAFEGKMVDIGFTDMQSVIIEEGPIMAVLFLCRV